MASDGWTTPGELVEQVFRLWERGELLRADALGEPLFPRALRLKRPGSKELGAQFGEVQRWVRSLQAGAEVHGYVIEWEAIEHRQLGANQVPARVVVPTMEAALRLVKKEREAARYRAWRTQVVETFPVLADWTATKPMKVLEVGDAWSGLLAVLRWFVANPRSGLYRRQLDIGGVDTKFIERHSTVLRELLEQVLPGEQVSQEPGASFDRRFGLREKPALVRFRILDEGLHLQGLSDLTVPIAELARLHLAVDEVLITENEVNGLALLPRPRALVVFGQGYAVERLAEVPWLASRRLLYWGDLDTHGFEMLDRFRAHFPAAESLLMDRETLLAHRALWAEETTQVTGRLERLTAPEALLHGELVRGTHGPRVRLEQERIAFGWVQRALG